MANVKNSSTVLALNVNCLTADGALHKTIIAEAGFHADIVKSFTDMKLKEKEVAKLQPKVTLANGELKIEDLNCKTADGAVKNVVARAPGYLNVSKGSARTPRANQYVEVQGKNL